VDIDIPAVPGHIEEALSSYQSEPKREFNPADTSPTTPPAPSISHGAEPSSTSPSTTLQPLPATISSGSADNSPVLNRIREPAKPSTHTLDSSTASEDTLNRKSAASAAANAMLHLVEESPVAYPPLKSVAKHLRLILDNCKVQSLSCTSNLQRSQSY
jgi:hypothetical protein